MLLSECCDLVKQRERSVRAEIYGKILEEAKRTLEKPPSVDAIHGALLAMQSLLNHTNMVGPLTADKARRPKAHACLSPSSCGTTTRNLAN